MNNIFFFCCIIISSPNYFHLLFQFHLPNTNITKPNYAIRITKIQKKKNRKIKIRHLLNCYYYCYSVTWRRMKGKTKKKSRRVSLNEWYAIAQYANLTPNPDIKKRRKKDERGKIKMEIQTLRIVNDYINNFSFSFSFYSKLHVTLPIDIVEWARQQHFPNIPVVLGGGEWDWGWIFFCGKFCCVTKFYRTCADEMMPSSSNKHSSCKKKGDLL